MTSRKLTNIAILRSILRPWTSEEVSFAALVGLSVSWVKKTSAGLKPISPKAAKAVSLATGVSADWLLTKPGEYPPVENDNATPYTCESYERWVANKSSVPEQHAVAGVAQGIASIVKSYCAALVAGKARPALNELWEFARFMECRYGRADDRDEQGILNEIQHKLDKVAVWDSKLPAFERAPSGTAFS